MIRWIACLVAALLPTLALAQAPSVGPVDIRNFPTVLNQTLSSATVTAGATTNSLATWMSYLNGTSNPNAVVFGSTISAANGGVLGGTFTGNTTLSGVVNLTGGGSLVGTFSGNNTLSGTVNLTGGGSFLGTTAWTGTLKLSGAGAVLNMPNGNIASLGGSFTQTHTAVQSGIGLSAGNGSIIQTTTASGFPTDGGLMTENLFHIFSSTQGENDLGMYVFDNMAAGWGTRIALQSSMDNVGYSSTPYPAWATGTVYALGQNVQVGNPAQVLYATSAGTSGATTPTCTIASPTCSDGTVTWKWFNLLFNAYQLIGGTATANGSVAFPGSSSSAFVGNVYGFNVVTRCNVANFSGCFGSEYDIAAYGATHYRVGMQMITLGGANFQGDIRDTALSFSMGHSAGSAGWKSLMQWGNGTGDSILDAAGYGIQAMASGSTLMTGAGGIDLSEFSPATTGPFGAGFAVRWGGGQLLSAGDIQSNAVLVHGTTTGATIDANESQVVSGTVATGGTGWAAGMLAQGADGSLIQITTVSSGVVTAFSYTLKAWAASPPSNPIIFTPQTPNGSIVDTAGNPTMPSTFTVNETWSTANSASPILTLGGTAKLSMGAAEWTANGSVATSVTSLGPTGSHTTIQKWFTVLDSDGTTLRYIPAY